MGETTAVRIRPLELSAAVAALRALQQEIQGRYFQTAAGARLMLAQQLVALDMAVNALKGP